MLGKLLLQLLLLGLYPAQTLRKLLMIVSRMPLDGRFYPNSGGKHVWQRELSPFAASFRVAGFVKSNVFLSEDSTNYNVTRTVRYRRRRASGSQYLPINEKPGLNIC